jgi:hypothetical protein
MWMSHTTWTTVSRPGGRTGAGTRNHCAHGKSVSVEEVLDWRPFEYYTCLQEVMPGKPIMMRETYLLTPLPETGGTRLQMTTVLNIPRVPRWISRQMCRLIMKYIAHVDQGMANLSRFVAEDIAGPERSVEMTPALAVA